MAADALAATSLDGEPIVLVRRGELVESVHRVAACACDDRGRTLVAFGTVDVPVYLRSSAKPFIAAAAVREGVVERFGIEPQELAVMAASHNGEPFAIKAVESLLKKIGAGEDALLCGAHAPYDEGAARALQASGRQFTAIHNNCSGKHAGILALCTALGADRASYLRPNNPAQQHILALCGRVLDTNADELPLAVDGCGIPVFATTLRRAALAFARLASLDGLDDRDAHALAAVRAAMLAHPQYVAGTGDVDTELMLACRGSLVVKSGAEGVFAAGSIPQRAGLVIKVVDGAARARPPAAMAVLEELDWLPADAASRLREFAQTPIYNRAGTLVGSISATLSAVASRHATKRST